MRDLLDDQFMTHFFPHQRPANAVVFSLETHVAYFELEDDEDVLYFNRGEGTAVYENEGNSIEIIN